MLSLLTPNSSIDFLKAFIDLSEKPLNNILPLLTTSSVANKKLENNSDSWAGFCIASDALVLFLEIFFNASSKLLAASSAVILIALFLPSNLCIPSNSS